jgi:hypothetical protein
VKFSFRQIFASAGGAVIAAVIASLFGVKGTVIGVAIGSAAATFGTAFVAQSIERGHAAVKQVAVRVPDRTGLLRRIGDTGTAGEAETTEPESSALTESITTATTTTTSDADDSTAVQAAVLGADATMAMQAVPGVTEPATEEIPVAVAERAPRSIPWRAISATAVVVFLLSLSAVTAIELIAGHPLSDLFNHSNSNNPSLPQFFTPSPPATTSTTTTSTSTTTTSSTTTSTTSTTVPSSSTTTTVGQGTTTTTAPGLNLFGTTTTTTSPGG